MVWEVASGADVMPSPLSRPGQLGSVLAFLSLFLLCPAPSVHAQAPRSTPGLVLATDGRTATCDILVFTPDGARLLAVGDDKVVRRWIMTDTGFSTRKLAP